MDGDTGDDGKDELTLEWEECEREWLGWGWQNEVGSRCQLIRSLSFKLLISSIVHVVIWSFFWCCMNFFIIIILNSVLFILRFCIYLTVQVLKQLGIGAQGSTYLVKRIDNNQLYALKMVTRCIMLWWHFCFCFCFDSCISQWIDKINKYS